MIEPQEQLSGSLIIIDFTKIYIFFLWKFVHFEKKCPWKSLCEYDTECSLLLDALVISYHHRNTGHKNLDQRQDIKRLDWWNDPTKRATGRFTHYHRFYKNLYLLSLEICSFRKKVSLKESLRISHGMLTTIRCSCEKLSSPEYWS